MDFEALTVRAKNTGIISTGDRISLFAYSKNEQKYAFASALVMKEIGLYEVNPSFAEIDKATAQILIDDLWLCGLRPSEGTGSAGSLMATQNHLSDMRKIVFKKLDIPL